MVIGVIMFLPSLPDSYKAIVAVLLAVFLNELPPDELFTRCAAVPADEAAWREFFRRYCNDIRVAIYRVIGFPPNGHHLHLFDDTLQRFHLRLLENDRRALLSFKGKTDNEARAFLRKISVSVACNVLRGEPPPKLSIYEPVTVKGEEPQSRIETLSDPANVTESLILLRDEIEHCLDQVLHGPGKYRSMLIFKLCLFDGLSPEEIASISSLKISSPHAVEQLVSRIRQKIRQYLEKA
jgi:DNA-directed RNA polymerase specialized sigma24 family protein